MPKKLVMMRTLGLPREKSSWPRKKLRGPGNLLLKQRLEKLRLKPRQRRKSAKHSLKLPGKQLSLRDKPRLMRRRLKH